MDYFFNIVYTIKRIRGLGKKIGKARILLKYKKISYKMTSSGGVK